MAIDTGDRQYEWIENWATIPETESGRTNGRTHGVDVTSDGRVVVFHQADPAVLIFDEDGALVDSWGSRFGGAHGLTLVEEDGREYLWLTDQDSAEVAKTTLDGETVMTLDAPDHRVYDDGDYVPTWVAVNERRHGGNGDIWVADGYGEDFVHRYDADGAYHETIDGTAGAGQFDCPHAVSFDYRGTDPELYIADRGNRRVQVYAANGTFERSFGAGELTSPCAFDTHEGDLVIPELYARVTVCDEDDAVTSHLGANESVVEHEDWPNVPDDRIEAGAFNSPHDAAVDDAGNLYVVEWIVGGRITKLERT
jgi:hypothetical protein